MMDKADEQKRIDRLYADNKAALEAAQESANKGDWQYFEKVPMTKAEQPTIAQARYTVADYELAEQCVSAANVVTCDGYYEVDIEKVAETLAKARTTSLAAQDGLVEALDDATIDEIILNFAGGVVQVPSEHNPRGYVSYYRPREAMRKALSAIKEQHHD